MKYPEILEFPKQRVSLCQPPAGDRLGRLVTGSPVFSGEPGEAVVEFGHNAGFPGVLLEGGLALRPAMRIDADEANAANLKTGVPDYGAGTQSGD